MKRSSRIRFLLPCIMVSLFFPSLSFSRPIDLPSAALDSALTYHHEKESDGYNRSPNIDDWNTTTGVPKGSSWCMSFVYSMYAKASSALGLSNPLMRTASVSQQLRHAASYGSSLKVIPIRGVYGAAAAYSPNRGDIICWKRRGGSRRDIGKLWPGHTGLAIYRVGPKLLTIEGNTGSNFADGDGCYKKWRPVNHILAVIQV